MDLKANRLVYHSYAYITATSCLGLFLGLIQSITVSLGIQGELTEFIASSASVVVVVPSQTHMLFQIFRLNDRALGSALY